MTENILTLATFITTTLGAGIGAYFATRSKKKGELDHVTENISLIVQQEYTKARKLEEAKIETISSKLETIVAQQKVLTSATEKVKSEIDLKNWLVKDNHQIRCVKIEQTYIALDTYLNNWANYLLGGEDFVDKFYTVKLEICMFLNLYFPYNDELQLKIVEFESVHSSLCSIFIKYTNQNENVPEEIMSELRVRVVNTVSSLQNYLVTEMSSLRK